MAIIPVQLNIHNDFLNSSCLFSFIIKDHERIILKLETNYLSNIFKTATNALKLIPTHSTTVVSPQHVFYSLINHLQEEDKTDQITKLIFLDTRPPIISS